MGLQNASFFSIRLRPPPTPHPGKNLSPNRDKEKIPPKKEEQGSDGKAPLLHAFCRLFPRAGCVPFFFLFPPRIVTISVVAHWALCCVAGNYLKRDTKTKGHEHTWQRSSKVLSYEGRSIAVSTSFENTESQGRRELLRPAKKFCIGGKTKTTHEQER